MTDRALRGHNDEKATENPGLPTDARGGMVEMGGIEPDPHNHAGIPLMRGFCAT